MNKPDPDLSALLPDDATLKARRSALVEAALAGEPDRKAAAAWRRRTPRFAFAAIVVVVAVAVALVLSAGGSNPPAAFAVEPQPGGGVRIQVYNFEDTSGLERALRDAGIRAQVDWLPAGTTCRDLHLKSTVVKLPGGGRFGGFVEEGPGAPTISVGSTRLYRESFGAHRRGEISDQELASFNLDPKAFAPSQTVVITGSPRPFAGDPEGGSRTQVQVAEGPVGRCKPVPAPAGSIGSIGLTESMAHAGAGSGRNAAGAEASDAPAGAPPVEGQYLYTKTIVTQLEGWLPNGPGTGSNDRPRYFTAHIPGNYPGAPTALVPTVKEVWTAPDGRTHVHETLGHVHFLSSADQRRWEEAGSPPPFEFDPAEHDVGHNIHGQPVKEYASRNWRGKNAFANVAKLAAAPTDPETLRLAIERRHRGSAPVPGSAANSERGSATAERLFEILAEPITSPALRAAALNALAEMPGISLRHDVVDAAGRPGDALAWVRAEGFGRELIFDPHSSQVLAQGEVIFDAKAAGYGGLPDNTVFRETTYLQSVIVDSPTKRPPED